MLVYFNTQPKVILSKAAALAAAKEGIIKKYPRIVADSLKLSASFDSATEVWTGYAEGIEAGVVSTPIVVSSSIFEDTAADNYRSRDNTSLDSFCIACPHFSGAIKTSR